MEYTKCHSPIYVTTKEFLVGDVIHNRVPVMCGHCPTCRLRKVREWIFRLRQEEKICTSSYFITLTYDTKSVPITRNGFMTLKKKDLQNFFKALRYQHDCFLDHDYEFPGSYIRRKQVDFQRFKYYAVGEYGDDRKRPHYHMIVFNTDPNIISRTWQYGHIDVGTVKPASMAYVLKYMNKDPFWRGQWFDGEPQFTVSSKRIGENYLTPNIIRWHKANLARNYSVIGSDIYPLSRYFRDKIFTPSEKHRQHKIIATAMQEQFQEDYEPFSNIFAPSDYIDSKRRAQLARYNRAANKRFVD